MTKALGRDPVALYSLLQARRKDLLHARRDAIRSKDRVTLRSLNAAVEQIDEALTLVVGHLNEIAAAEEAESAAEELATEPAVDEAAAPSDEVPSDEAVAELMGDEETVSPADAETDEVLEEEPAEEPAKAESSVAMKATLRRAMGDVAADLLDDYAQKIQQSVNTFFENLTSKALELGSEDPSDSSNSLREQLLTEIGRRGLERVEPNFLEWREGLIKQLMKDVARSFEAPEPEQPEEEKPELEIPTGEVPEEAAAEAEAPEAEAPAEEAAEEAEEPEAEAPAEEAPPMKMPASVSASVSKPIVFAQAVSFTVHRDLKPTSARSIKLS